MPGRTSGDLDILSKSNRITLSRSLSSKATPLRTRGRGLTLTPTDLVWPNPAQALLCKHIRIVIISVEPKPTFPKRSKILAMCHSNNSSHQLATILVWDLIPSRASTSARLCSSAPRHACSRSPSTSSSTSVSRSPSTVSKTRNPVVPGEVGSRKSAAQKTEKAATRERDKRQGEHGGGYTIDVFGGAAGSGLPSTSYSISDGLIKDQRYKRQQPSMAQPWPNDKHWNSQHYESQELGEDLPYLF